MRFETTFEVNAPLSECYHLCLNVEHDPAWGEVLKAISRLGASRTWNWQITAQSGLQVGWESHPEEPRIRQNPNVDTASRNAMPTDDPDNQGQINLSEGRIKRTRLEVVVEPSVEHALRDTDVTVLGQMLERAFESLRRGLEGNFAC